MEVVRLSGSIPWLAGEAVEGPWVAECDSLGLTAQSGTWADLTDDIASALELMFADLREEGLLGPLFEQHGWTPGVRDLSEPGASVDDCRLDIPFSPRLASRDAEAQVTPA